MKTTSLFVELVVTGIGASVWFALMILCVFGTQWLPLEHLLSPQMLIPLLAFAYLLGVLTDRAAKALFGRLSWSATFTSCFLSKEDFFRARRRILTESERLSDDLTYDRSRLRICRGWALNALLIAVFLNLLVWTRTSKSTATFAISVWGTIICLLLSLACALAWRAFRDSGYRKIERMARWLRETEEARVTDAPGDQ